MIPSREKAFELLKKYVKNEKMICHCVASEVVLRAIANKLGHDEDLWSIAGLLHDIDVEITNADMLTHGLEAVKILEKEGFDPEMIEAIKLHNEAATNIKRTKPFHFALASGETITGLIFATALVYPDKSVMSVQPKSITKRMKEKAFAASVSRENILECEKIGIPLPEFAAICLKAIQDNKDAVGVI